MRRYLRHPSGIPIELRFPNTIGQHRHMLKDVGEGGLCFRAHIFLEPGTEIHILIPLQHPPFEADGVVAWCRKAGNEFEVGVRFCRLVSNFGLRMVEQLCYIEQYRHDILQREGRQLTSEEAAAEWISRFAGQFPR